MSLRLSHASRVVGKDKAFGKDTPLLIRLSGSVLERMWHKVVVIILHSTWVTVLTELQIVNLGISNTAIAAVSIVVGLLLTYRTNTAYDRYWEARRLWSTLQSSIRNLCRTIWVNLPEKGGSDTKTCELLDRKSCINLLLAFAVATKHYLREEEGIEHEDLHHLLQHIPHYALPSGLGRVEEQDQRFDHEILKQHTKIDRFNKHETETSIDELKGPNSLLEIVRPNSKKGDITLHSTLNHNIPLEITLYLQSYVAYLREAKKLDVPTTNQMNQGINSLVDCLTNMERILSTPIPLAYSIHLSQTTWIYCLSLPFQLVPTLGYITIPAVTLASFILLGIASIGREIENPFGEDKNDLDLDDFCKVIRLELDCITRYPAPIFEDWSRSKLNRALYPSDWRGRDTLDKLNAEEIRRLLSNDKSAPSTISMTL